VKRLVFAIVITVLLVMSAQGAFSATFTISNQTEFYNALNSARLNGEDDTIVMAAGTYSCGTVPMFENHSLTIQGAGTGLTIITPADYAYGFEYQTMPGNDSAAHLTLKGVTLRGAMDTFSESGLRVTVDQANITIEDCEFRDNVSHADGTGLYIKASGTSTVMLRNNVFSNNSQTDTVSMGAGASVASYGPITIEKNTFTGNRSLTSGGGLAAFADGSSQLTLKGNTFISNIARNEAGDEGMGGGVSVVSHNGAVIMVNNIFFDNSSHQSGAAQIQSLGSGDITVVNNTFYKNSAGMVGGLWVWPKASSASVVNIYNNILYGNGTSLASDLFVYNDSYQTVKLYNNNVNIWAAAESTPNQDANINEDPMLNDLWHLIKDSPCIDKGLASAPSLPATDIDGNPRSINGAVDIGAAEYTGAEVKISDVGYAGLQEAYDHANSGDVIKVPATVLTEDLTFFRPVNVVITGGYKYDYVQSQGFTTLYGSMTIKGGGTVGCGWFKIK
jgi:hypothetical protein